MHYVPNQMATVYLMKLLITLIILLSSSDRVRAFSERQLHFEITEGVPNGTLIGRVTYPATGQHLHDSPPRNETAQNGKHEQKGWPIPKEDEEPGEEAQFRLSGQCDFASFEPKSGEIRTAVERLDREAIREANATFRMVLVSPGHANIITVHVHVLDINDNQPVFPCTLQNVSVVESAAIGTRIALQSARDADLGENGTIVEYRIISEDSEQEQQPVFSLVHSTDSTATTSGNDLLLLELQRELDRETRDFYVFNISAADGGDPPRFGYSTVHVHVLDTNDNAPKFERSHYEVRVSPNSLDEINHQLVTVHARDADSGRNGRISYRLSGAGAGGEEQFGIWTENGTIFAKERNLNCSRTTAATTSTVNPSTGDLNNSSTDSKSRLCVISVEAQDHGEPPLAGHAFVNVWLTESNDHDPVIHFRMYPPESRFASISEAAQVGDTIAVVTVTDEDYGQTADVRIADQEREGNSEVDQAAERGRLTSDGNSADLFRLESGQNFGVVRLNRALTNEDIANQPFRIKLIATDNGYPLARRAHRTLQVFVLRRNETAPQLHAEAIELHLRDDSPIGALVTVVRAVGTGLMNFSIVTPVGTVDKSSNPEAFFRISEHSGVITVARSLRDIQRNRKGSASPRTHQLQVDVRTARPSLKSARCAVTIHIDSVRRRPPVFEKKQYSIEVPEDIALQSVLLTVRALYQDTSADNSSQISYSIVENAARTMFAVREKTGEIVLRRHLDREHRDRYEFTVEARDHQPDQRTGTGIAQGSGTAQVRVDVTDVNDNAPYFMNASRLYCFLRRSARPGAEIARLVARDADLGPFGRITYQLHQAPVDLGLDLDETSGLLYLGDSPKAADLLRNKREREFQVLIGAKDGGGLVATSNLSIALQLVDDDEEVPRFSPRNWSIEVDENSVPGLSIGRFQLENAKTVSVRYRLAEPYGRSATAAEQLQLKIDERSGEITLADSPDRELLIGAPDQSAIPFTVTASDGRLTVQHSGHIIVVDRNDNAPRFLATAERSHHHNTVQLKIWAPTTPLGGQLAKLDAEDADSGWSAQIRYETDSEFFWIDPETGVLSYQKRLPEGTDQLQFHVTATDGGQPPLSTQLRVLVDVEHEEQVHDFPARFIYSVSEDTRPGTIIGHLVPENATVRYEFCSSSNTASQQSSWESDHQDFKNLCGAAEGLEGTETSGQAGIGVLTSGEVVVLDELDRELKPFYRLAVVVKTRLGAAAGVGASEPELEPLSMANSSRSPATSRQFIEVDVYIEDINDNAPECPKQMTFYVAENLPPYSVVGVLNGLDRDAGLNGTVFYDAQMQMQINEDATSRSAIGSIRSDHQSASSKFEIDHNTGVIRTRVWLDRELQASYKWRVRLTDGGGLERECLVTIRVEDRNDQAPEFSKRFYHFEVNDLRKHEIGRLVARDGDDLASGNGQVRYYLHESATTLSKRSQTRHFKVNPVTGELRHDGRLQYGQIYNLSVLARDQPKNPAEKPLSSQISLVFVNVSGTHQELFTAQMCTPVFVSFPEKPLKIRESWPIGAVLGSVRATLPSTCPESFRRNGDTMIHYSLSIVDEAHQSQGGLDGGPEGRQTPSNPRKPGNSLENIRQKSSRGEARIAEGGLFWIDAEDGDIRLVGRLQAHRSQKYLLKVMAQVVTAADGNLVGGNASIAVELNVEDVNDHAPVIETEQIHIKENNEPGQVCGLIRVRDDDLGENGRVQLRILHQLPETSGHFRLEDDSSSGAGGGMKLQQQGSAIKLLCEDVLDRERVPAYKLLLEAEDCGRPARKSLKMISIIVDDENDNAPLCAGADHILLDPPQPNGPQKPFQVKLQCFDLDQDEDQSSLNGLLGYELLISDGATDWTDKVASDNVDKSDNGRTDDKVRLHGDMLTIDMRLHQTTAPFSFAVRVFDRFNASAAASSTMTTTTTGAQRLPPHDPLRRSTERYFTVLQRNPSAYVRFPASSQHLPSILVPRTTPLGTVVGQVQATAPAPHLIDYYLTEFRQVAVDQSCGPRSCDYEAVRWLDVDRKSGQLRMTRRPYLLDYMEEEGEAREWRVEITAIWNGFTASQMVIIRFDDGNEFAGNDGSVGERERNFERFFEFDLPEDPGNPPLPAAAGKSSQAEHGDLVSQPGSSRGRFVGTVRMEETSNRILRTTNGEQRAADLPGNSGGQNSRELEWEYQIELSEWSQAFEIDTRTGTLKTAAGRRRWIDFEEVQHIVLVVIATRHSNRTQSTDPTMKSLRVSSKSEQKSQTPEANRARARARSATSTRTAAIRRRICVHLQILDVNDNRPKFVVADTVGMAWNSGKAGSNPGSFRASGHPQPSAEFDGSGGYREGGDQDQATNSAAPIWMWVKEDAQLGQFVGAVLAQDADSGLFGQVSYELKEGAPEALQIDPDSGILTVAGSGLDHERETVHQFEIQARDGAGLTSRIRVVLFVVDVNDNRPQFELDEYRVEVLEDAAPGTKLLQVNVSDADADSEFWFDIALPGNELELFAIDRNNGVVKLVGALDRELQHKHQLELVVHDQKWPRKAFVARTRLTVVVTDVNDNAPRFRSPPVFFVREHAPNGSLVGVVEALDPDAGWNAQVHYRIVPESHPQAVFLIDPVFGYLQVNGRLDGARQRLYHLTLEAFDSGLATVHVSTMQITVVVMKSDCDSGDSAEDTKWILNDTFYGKVLENATLGQPVVQVLAESGAGDAGDKADDGDGADVKLFEIEGGDPRGVFEIGSRSGLITIRKHLDADLESRYNLSVSVRHSIDAPKQITRVLIEVGDLNDESPRFVNTGGDHWLLRLAENLRGPFPIHLGTTLAEDRDNWSSRNVSSTIAYAILQGNTSLFAVDPQTGRLMLLAPLDRELQSEHRLLIQALDLGDGPQRRPQAPSATATLHVTILVEDQNDNWPQFELPQYQAWIEENGEVGQLVARIQASDADCGENARLSYSLSVVVPGPPSNREVYTTYGMKQQQHYSLESAIPFRIDPLEGAIYTTGSLDREQRGEWTLEVRAEDNGRFERRSNSTRLIVVVGDRNDNEPVILNDLYDVFIPQGLQKGDLVHCLRAADADQNDTLTLAIAPAVAGDSDPDESSGFFRIDQRNGAILVARSLEAKDFYRVTVTVADGGGHSSAATFNFYVGGGHGKFGKNFPRFEKPTRSEFVVKEGASSNPITTFRAAPPGRQFITKTKDDDNSSHRDDNSSQDDVIRYAIACGDRWGAFRIHPSNGQLYATAKLDYELQNRFDLVISARFITPPTDSSQANGYHPQADPIGGSSLPPLFAYTQVTILVEDLNDNAPIFDQSIYKTEVRENSDDFGAENVLVQIEAKDADSGRNAQINYSILDDDEQQIRELFRINQTSGVIWAMRALDAETSASYQLRVKATDGGSPPLSDFALVQVHVLDENDNSPKFSRLFRAEVEENAPIGTFVTQVSSADADAGSVVEYRFDVQSTASEAAPFWIDPRSGVISTTAVLDREQKSEYTLKVVAADGLWQVRTSVVIRVLDQNDHAPRFSQESFRFRLRNDVAAIAGSFVGQVNASDPDEAQNGLVLYSLLCPGGRFSIDPLTGRIFVAWPWNSLILGPSLAAAGCSYIVNENNNNVSSDQHIEVRCEVKASNQDASSSSSLETKAVVTIEIPLNDDAQHTPEEVSSTSTEFGAYEMAQFDYLGNSLPPELGHEPFGEMRQQQDEEGQEGLQGQQITRRSALIGPRIGFIRANSPPLTNILQLRREWSSVSRLPDDPSLTLPPQDSSISLHYRILDDDLAKLFTIDSATGILKSKHPLNAAIRSQYVLPIGLYLAASQTKNLADNFGLDSDKSPSKSTTTFDPQPTYVRVYVDDIGGDGGGGGGSGRRKWQFQDARGPNGSAPEPNGGHMAADRIVVIEELLLQSLAAAQNSRDQANINSPLLPKLRLLPRFAAAASRYSDLVQIANTPQKDQLQLRCQLSQILQHKNDGHTEANGKNDKALIAQNCSIQPEQLINPANPDRELLVEVFSSSSSSQQPHLNQPKPAEHHQSDQHLPSTEHRLDSFRLTLHYRQIPPHSATSFKQHRNANANDDDDESLLQQAVLIQLWAMPGAVADLLDALQQSVPDMTIRLVGVEYGGLDVCRLLVSALDRNGALVQQDETYRLLQHYFNTSKTKNQRIGLERGDRNVFVRDLVTDLCTPTGSRTRLHNGARKAGSDSGSGQCLNGGRCEQIDTPAAAAAAATGAAQYLQLDGRKLSLIVPVIRRRARCLCQPGTSGDRCELRQAQCGGSSSLQCLNGGSCDPLTRLCVCPEAYTGARCEISQADGDKPGGIGPQTRQFHAESFMEIRMPPMRQGQRVVSLEFRTKLANALLLYSYSTGNLHDYVALDISDGRLRLAAASRLAAAAASAAPDPDGVLLLSNVSVNDGAWRRVRVESRPNDAAIKFTLDQCQASAEEGLGCQPCAQDDHSCKERLIHVQNAGQFWSRSDKLLVGGIKDIRDIQKRPNQVSAIDFVGCIRHLQVDDRTLDAQQNALEVLAEEGVIRQTGCGPVNSNFAAATRTGSVAAAAPERDLALEPRSCANDAEMAAECSGNNQDDDVGSAGAGVCVTSESSSAAAEAHCVCKGGFDAASCRAALQEWTLLDGSVRFGLTRYAQRQIAFVPAHISANHPQTQAAAHRPKRRAPAASAETSAGPSQTLQWLRDIPCDEMAYEAGDQLDGVLTQWAELDFRTTSSGGDGTTLLAVVEAHKSTHLRLRNGSVQMLTCIANATPIEVHLNVPVNDGLWHRLGLQIGSNGKTLRFQVDGHGKEVRAAEAFPQLISASLRYISIGGQRPEEDDANNGVKARAQAQAQQLGSAGFTGCVRRFIVNNQAQLLQNSHDSSGSQKHRLTEQLLEVLHSDGSVRLGCALSDGALLHQTGATSGLSWSAFWRVLWVGLALAAACLSCATTVGLCWRRYSTATSKWPLSLKCRNRLGRCPLVCTGGKTSGKACGRPTAAPRLAAGPRFSKALAPVPCAPDGIAVGYHQPPLEQEYGSWRRDMGRYLAAERVMAGSRLPLPPARRLSAESISGSDLTRRGRLFSISDGVLPQRNRQSYIPQQQHPQFYTVENRSLHHHHSSCYLQQEPQPQELSRNASSSGLGSSSGRESPAADQDHDLDHDQDPDQISISNSSSADYHQIAEPDYLSSAPAAVISMISRPSNDLTQNLRNHPKNAHFPYHHTVYT